jgi:biopolymer transport protein ExbB
MPEILQHGGLFIWLIVLCSVASVAIFLERTFHLHRAHIHAEDFMKGIRNHLRRGNFNEAQVLGQETPGPIAQMLRAALAVRDSSRDEIRQAIEDAGLTEVARLERNLPILATLAQITPLLGLLGTVSGFIQVFSVLREKSVVQLRDLSGGIMEALICTAAGLTAAIFCYVAYNYLATRVQSIVNDMNKHSSEILALLIENRPPGAQPLRKSQEKAQPPPGEAANAKPQPRASGVQPATLP